MRCYHFSARITVEYAFGDIDLRWIFVWKRLCESVDTNIMICEGAMRMYNFLLDYIDVYGIDDQYECMLFNNDCSDNGQTSKVVYNYSVRPSCGRSTS